MRGQVPATVRSTGTAAARMALLLILVLVIGAVDYVTGPHLSFFIFYMIPVGLGALYVGRSGGLVISVASAVVWYAADSLGGRVYPSAWYGYWNSAIRLAMFSWAALILVRLKKSTDQEKSLARTDPLTGIPNSRAFYEIAGREIHRASRSETPLSAAYIDLDGFKQVNDQGGHEEGDRVLRHCAEVISESIRRSDLAARLGGDEFAILLPDASETESGIAIGKVRARLQEAMSRRNWPVTFSIGLVTFRSPPHSVDELIREADGLMYSVKTSGKDSIKARVVE